MINLSELNATLKDFINQFGLPNDSNSRMYISLLKEGLTNNPREAHLLELSIQEKIPQRLFAQKDNIQDLFPQIIQELCSKYQIDSPFAEWVIQVWLDAFGLKMPSSSYQQDNQSNQLRKTVTPPVIEQSQTQIQKCNNCGKKLPDNAEFCPACGTHTQKKSDTGVPTSGIRQSNPQIQKCYNCGKTLPENADFCPACGTHTQRFSNTGVSTSGIRQSNPQIQKCYNCGKTLPDNAEFCPVCGSKAKKYLTSKIPEFMGEITTDLRRRGKNIDCHCLGAELDNNLILILLGGIICLISIFLPFITVNASIGAYMSEMMGMDLQAQNNYISTSLFDQGTLTFLLYLILIMGLFSIFILKYDKNYPYLYLAIGVLVLFITIYLVFNITSALNIGNQQLSGFGVKGNLSNLISFSYGLYTELIGAALIIVGGFFNYSKNKIKYY
ncbi:zinc-ribbon domain-containing protein [Methanospirillum stamsii]|uniref:DZANK-type domain-containing protein n=1 Tax=Methanospirillum stamsii TaxID=1277351 RepID=A0A2V2N2F2_9EURY|nr:zinc-ribbon domain-containing protein [Methanospirillum stamsii]PWR70337.1 hypothetical protein DLD82_16170 [Methanospirillum stamsii]